MSRPKLLFLGVLAAIVVVVGLARFATHNTPAGQPPLAYINPDSLAGFKADFNNAAGETRMIVLLSPT